MNVQEILERDYVDGPEAARILNLSQMRIRALCQGERFEGAFKFGSVWIIPKIAVKNHTKLKSGAKPQREKTQKLIEKVLKENEAIKSKK